MFFLIPKKVTSERHTALLNGWFVGEKPCGRQMLRNGNADIGLSWLPPTDVMEELNALGWETLLEMDRFS